MPYKLPSVYFLNPTSLAKPNKLGLLESNVMQNKAEMALLTETWLCKKHLDKYISLNILSYLGG